jgi:hypothetical protein|tara:strand:+ start:307 stop:702 length:396 start_codon:yes stop_codon:yes gene_type:complete
MQKVTDNVVDFKPEWEMQWIRCKPYIEEALRYQDSYTIDHVEDKISNGLFHLWAGKESALVTEFVIFPKHKVLNLLFCGGDYNELVEMLPSIEAFARAAECKRLYGGGRKGWSRKLKHLGFEEEHMIRKEL